MLDLKLLRENPQQVAEGLKKRGIQVDLFSIQQDLSNLKKIEEARSNLQSRSNKIGKEVGNKIKEGLTPKSNEILNLRNEGNKLKEEISILEDQEKILSLKLKKQILNLPNIPSKECPKGTHESQNLEIKKHGKIKQIKNPKTHWEIGKNLNLFDSERSSKIAKSRFVTLFNQGAKLERALINFMIDVHTSNGYTEVLPPSLINTSSLTGSGQLPKFAEESFQCKDDDLWLSPTAEVPLTAIHKDEIIPSTELPIKYVAYSPCFRREAGSYGRDTKGLIRLHQFNKVELYWICNPDELFDAHKKITEGAELILKTLELPYRVVDLCCGDLGFSAKRTYDLEVWLPGSNKYREISSCSYCGDFQARRSSIRTKIEKNTKLVHTLNGSGLAVGRTMAALLENGQRPDGSVSLPKAIVPYFGNTEISLK